jgi:hypothetical protein
VLMHAHGTPRVPDVFAFIAGGLIGYGLMSLLARGDATAAATLGRPMDRALGGAMNWLATGAAVSAAALLAEIHGWEAWPLSSLAATVAYLLCAGLQLSFALRRRARRRAAPAPSPRRPGRTTRSPAPRR